jgi:hypothetical protein
VSIKRQRPARARLPSLWWRAAVAGGGGGRRGSPPPSYAIRSRQRKTCTAGGPAQAHPNKCAAAACDASVLEGARASQSEASGSAAARVLARASGPKTARMTADSEAPGGGRNQRGQTASNWRPGDRRPCWAPCDRFTCRTAPLLRPSLMLLPPLLLGRPAAELVRRNSATRQHCSRRATPSNT